MKGNISVFLIFSCCLHFKKGRIERWKHWGVKIKGANNVISGTNGFQHFIHSQNHSSPSPKISRTQVLTQNLPFQRGQHDFPQKSLRYLFSQTNSGRKDQTYPQWNTGLQCSSKLLNSTVIKFQYCAVFLVLLVSLVSLVRLISLLLSRRLKCTGAVLRKTHGCLLGARYH